MIALCVTTIINLTASWTLHDQVTLEHAKVRCQQLYPDAPCLKQFIKKEPLLHNAVCGK